MKNKTDNQLKEDISRNESLAEWGGYAVIFGLVMEVVTAFLFADGPISLGTWGLVGSNTVVTLGVAAEVLFSRKARARAEELQTRSDKKVAETIERAAALEKEAALARERTAEIERITAWRRVSLEQLRSISAGLEPIAPSIRVFFEYQMGDPEAFMLAHELSKVFSNISGHTSNSWFGPAVFGASISISPDIDKSLILAAFERAGVILFEQQWNALKMWPIPQSDPRPNVLIAVYPKAPPEFPSAASTAETDKT